MAPILVTGTSGQLATLLKQLGGADIRLAGRPELDFEQQDAIPAVLAKINPRLIINAAAYTAVDKAESEPEQADRANHLAPALIAQYCAKADIPLIHVSTDYVFDGSKGSPYLETDTPSPTGVYGRTKLAGERAVLASAAKAIILRTSWVYSSVGKNFVLTMLNAAQKVPKLRVVADQRGCPTNAADLASAILSIVRRIDEQGWQSHFSGVFHATGQGETTWHGLASAVFELGARFGAAMPEVEAITTSDWPTPARRPADSRLDGRNFTETFKISLPLWQKSLAGVVSEVLDR